MGGGQVSVFGWSWQSRLYCVVQLGALGVRSVRYFASSLCCDTFRWTKSRRRCLWWSSFIMVADSLVVSPLEVFKSALGYQKIISYSWQLILVGSGVVVFVTVWGVGSMLSVPSPFAARCVVLMVEFCSPGISWMAGLVWRLCSGESSFALWLPPRFYPLWLPPRFYLLWLKYFAFLSICSCDLKQCHHKVALVTKQNLHLNLFNIDDVSSYVNDVSVTRRRKASWH